MKLNVGKCTPILSRNQREEVMYEFKAGRINILVATDIVARGIDIDDIRLVINYDARMTVKITYTASDVRHVPTMTVSPLPLSMKGTDEFQGHREFPGKRNL